MKTKLTLLSLINVGVLSIALADQHTDKGHVAVKHSLTLEGAKQVGEAAAKYAKENGAGPSIAIVDDGGHLLYLQRTDETQIGSIEVAQQKAHSAVAFKRPTKVFEDAVAGGRIAILKLPGAIPVEGGLPLMVDGKIVGSIGCSGGTSQQDGVVAHGRQRRTDFADLLELARALVEKILELVGAHLLVEELVRALHRIEQQRR